MSLFSRLLNVLRPDRLTREIDEELESHLADAIEHGRDPAEARRALGASLLQRDASRDIRLIPWLDSLRADAVFGWRQLMKKKVDYGVLQRRREIGIRMAIGAQAGDIARRVTGDVLVVVLVGAVAGLGLGLTSARYIGALFYQVKPTDAAMLAVPSLTIFAVALIAAMPAVIRAVRIDPAATLRAD